MKKLLRCNNHNRWELEGIEFAIKERAGQANYFIGRIEELEFLYNWADNIKNEISRSIAFLGRRKIGKSLILERLYNIIYSENKGLIPFYYEFYEGSRTAKKFFEDFICRFYLQVAGYYTRDITLNRRGVDRRTKVDFSILLKKLETLDIPHKNDIISDLNDCVRMLKKDQEPYEYVITATASPAGFAMMPGVEEKIVQMIDERTLL